jgi:CRP-like cAMP-binding protein
MPHRKNFLLDRLNPALLDRLRPHLTITDLERGEVLAETHKQVHKVYFPHTGIISCVVELIGGGAIETGMIGHDGVFGGAQALDDKVSLNHVVMQISGTASVISSDALRGIADDQPAIRSLLVKYEQFFLAQVQQTAACNAAHNVQSRTCKWLLRMHALAGADLDITQEFLAQMMGVRRTSVSEVTKVLQRAGMIAHRRGHIGILDLDLVKQSACECFEDVRSHYRRIFISNEADEVHRERL